MNKMVINHIEKLFVTNDAATILKELEVNKKHAASNETSSIKLVTSTSYIPVPTEGGASGIMYTWSGLHMIIFPFFSSKWKGGGY